MIQMTAISSTELIRDESKLLDNIRMSVGETEQVFEGFYMPFIRVSADFAQQLPLSKKIFREARGAFQFSLIVAQVALNNAQSKIFFPAAPQEERRLLERQSWFMSYISAIMSSIALTYQHISIEDRGEAYHPLLDRASLRAWLENHPNAVMHWRIDEPRFNPSEAAAIAAIMVPKGILANFDLRVVRSMYSSILPSSDPGQIESTMSRVVREAMHAVLSFYAKEEARRYREEIPESPQDLTLAVPIETSGNAAPIEHQPEKLSEQAPSPISEIPQELKELFSIFKQHEHYRAMVEKIVVTEKGIELPLQILGSFGLRPVTVFEMLEKSGLVVEKSPNGKAVVLVPELKSFLLDE